MSDNKIDQQIQDILDKVDEPEASNPLVAILEQLRLDNEFVPKS